MPASLSPRLNRILDALPLGAGLRVLEIGCGPGALAREGASRPAIATGRPSFRRVAVEAFVLDPDEDLFDLAVAIRVGALDGRHPELQARALARIAEALAPHGRLFIDGGDPLRAVPVAQQA